LYNIIDILRNALTYDANTGFLYWREKPDAPQYNSRWAGERALNTIQKFGKAPYGRINRTVIKARDAAFAIIHGEFRTDLYHWNGNVADNRILNIRAHSYRQTGGFPPEYYMKLWEAGFGVIGDTGEVIRRSSPKQVQAPSDKPVFKNMNDLLSDPMTDMYPDDRDDWW
jgi:hypothetical protein